MKKELLAAGCLLLALAAMSCGSETPETEPRSSTPDESSAETRETEPASDVVYDIPDPELPALDLTGQYYTFFCKGEEGDYEPDGNFRDRDFLASNGLMGEVVNDAVFNRNLKVEQKFGCSVRLIVDETSPERLIMGGEDSFDIVCGDSVDFGDTMNTGAYLDFMEFPYINLTSEYWSPICVRDTIFRGKIFMMPSDICLMPFAQTGLLYFNKRILSEYDMESPYDMVHNNTWTIENWLNMIKQVHADVNGDGVMDTEDLYGALVMAQFRLACFMQFYVGSGKVLTAEDPEAGRVIAVDGEFAQNLIDLLTPVLEDKTVSLNNYDVHAFTGDFNDYFKMFMDGHCLFIQALISTMDLYREMEDDFGIVPNPKYDASQESYYHRVCPRVPMFTIPATVTDYEKVGAVTEYMAWLSHYTVLPAYYEVTIKQKRTRDEDAIEMLDIVRRTMVFDFGDVYDTYLPNYLYDSYKEGSYARKFGSCLKMLTKRLAHYTKILDALGE
ncbi:MAG: hypothetical protein II719_04545 [Clostridia bacterium]|nr:hypothetical protein [Clostridia bacterium]